VDVALPPGVSVGRGCGVREGGGALSVAVNVGPISAVGLGLAVAGVAVPAMTVALAAVVASVMAVAEAPRVLAGGVAVPVAAVWQAARRQPAARVAAASTRGVRI